MGFCYIQICFILVKEKLPPTDSRLRPDQRHLENGEYEKANEEKQRLERRQRMVKRESQTLLWLMHSSFYFYGLRNSKLVLIVQSRKIQESGWRPRWFEPRGESDGYKYTGGYWEARDERSWDGCPNIFGEFTEEIADCA